MTAAVLWIEVESGPVRALGHHLFSSARRHRPEDQLNLGLVRGQGQRPIRSRGRLGPATTGLLADGGGSQPGMRLPGLGIQPHCGSCRAYRIVVSSQIGCGETD
jgi:hypothetical protein